MRVSAVAQRLVGTPDLLPRPALDGRVGGAAGRWPWLVRLIIALLTILCLLCVVWVVPVY
jgi:hypothetical protein